jgi:DNA-directed RNA polymerase alpha subunit
MNAPWDYESLLAHADPKIREAELSVRAVRCLLQWKPDITLEYLASFDRDILRAHLFKIKGLGRRTVNEIMELVDSYKNPSLWDNHHIEIVGGDEYARRQDEALEKIEAALVEILVELRRL